MGFMYTGLKTGVSGTLDFASQRNATADGRENRWQINQTRQLGALFAICPSIQAMANFLLTLMAGSPIETQRWLSLKAGLVSTPKRLWSWSSNPTVTWRRENNRTVR